MSTLTLRRMRDIAIISDVRMRDLKSFHDWLVGIVATALVIGGAAVASAVAEMLPL